MQPKKFGEKPLSVPIQSVTIQNPPQNQVANANVVHVQVVSTNHMATVSFVFGVLTIFSFGFAIMVDEFELCLYIWIIGVLAIVFGHIGLREAARTGIGKGFAVAGLALGYTTLAVYAAGIVFVILLLQSLGF
jgi:uncharacterized membrane protein